MQNRKARIAVLVSGGGTNLQALLDAEKSGIIKSGKIELVIANNAGAYALERAAKAGIKTATVLKKELGSAEAFEQKIKDLLTENGIEIEKEIVDGMAEYFTDNFSDASEITDEMASDVILSYYDAYLKYKEQE